MRILLVEDHQTVREGLKLLIKNQPDMEVIGEAGDGRTAIESAQALQPDLVVMDISMPEMNGLQATKKIKKACPQVIILVLTRHTEEGFLQQLLRAGASGYVLKQSAPTELISAMRAVISGKTYLDPSIAGKVVENRLGRRGKPKAEPPDDITDREAEILRLTAWGQANKEIAAQLDISVKTVEAHRANAMRKLNIKSRLEIVRYALLRGWLRED